MIYDLSNGEFLIISRYLDFWNNEKKANDKKKIISKILRYSSILSIDEIYSVDKHTKEIIKSDLIDLKETDANNRPIHEHIMFKGLKVIAESHRFNINLITGDTMLILSNNYNELNSFRYNIISKLISNYSFMPIDVEKKESFEL